MCVQANEALQNVIDSYDQQFHDRKLEALRLAEHRNEELEARQSLWNIWFSLHADKAVCCCGFADCKKRKSSRSNKFTCGPCVTSGVHTSPK